MTDEPHTFKDGYNPLRKERKMRPIKGKFYNFEDDKKLEFITARKDMYVFLTEQLDSYILYEADLKELEEWQEPVVLEGWVNIYKSGFVLHDSKEEAEENASDLTKLEATLHIKIDLSQPEGKRVWEVIG